MDDSIRYSSLENLEEYVLNLGEKKFRAKQLHDWVFKRGITSYNEISNLPKLLINSLKNDFALPNVNIKDIQIDADDGSKKYLLELDDKSYIEAVLMPHLDDDNCSICLSTQVGCPINCSFCATGKQGFTRNLTFDEIVSQFLIVNNDCENISNIVIMGQGEPFLNYDNVVNAMHFFNTSECVNIGARKITVSTSGLIEGIKKFSDINEQYRLAVSLHSCDQITREQIMPIAKKNNLKDLKKALIEYNEKTNRRVTLEYLLLQHINESFEDAKKLVAFCEGLNCNINILDYNEVPDVEFRTVDKHNKQRFLDYLTSNGLNVSCRTSRGKNIAGACGQLANTHK